MPSIIEKIALKVLSHYLDNYINPIQGNQLKLALTTGKAELNNVSIKSTALSIHHLPFTVTSGVIQSIKLHFPWQSLKKTPCEIEIDGINIIANFTKDVKVKSDVEVKEAVLKELEEAGLGDEKIKSAIFQGTISQILSNIIIRVKNVHIRVEIDTPDPKINYAVGVMFKQIECFSISETGQQTFVQPDANISKRIQIQDFSIYADPQPEPLDLPTSQEKVEEYLRMRYDEKHEFILDSFSFSTDYIITKQQLQTHSNMANQIDQILFKLTQKQMVVFGEYFFQYNLFQLRQKYSLLGRPSQPPIDTVELKEKKIALNWWQFLHKTTIEKRYPNRINIPESIQILKTRNKYYNIWKIRQKMTFQDFKKNLNYSKLKEIEEKLPLNSILFLRSYSDYRINKEKARESKLVVDKSDLEMLTNSNTFENSTDISLLINKIKVNIFESTLDKEPILTFSADELSSKFNQSFDKNIIFSLICKTMKVYSKDKVIFQQDSSSRSSIELNYKSLIKVKEDHVDIVASAPFINVDLKFLYKLKVMLYDNGFNECPSANFFSLANKVAAIMATESNKNSPYMIKKGQYSDMILQKKCDEFSFLKLKMKLLSPTVHIQGAKLSFKMKEINFESFPIHDRFADQPETLYSNYLIKCIDFTIGLGENQILKPVTADFNFGMIIAPVEWLDKFRIALNISSIAVIFTKETYGEIVTGLGQLLKLSQEFEQTDDGKALAQQQKEQKEEESKRLKLIDDINVERISTNYATKVSILFNNISLELVSVGKFDINNFETQITVGSNGLGLNLRIQNIICNSLESKYIFFDVNEKENEDDHFLKENNAIVCQYTLFFDKAMKINMSVNSPTIIIDFGWLETAFDFFRSANIKALMSYQPKQPILDEPDRKMIETVMTNSIEFQLLKPTFKVILPAVNKYKDDVELTLKIDYISYGEIEKQKGENENEKQSMLLKMPTFSFEWKKRLTATINNFQILTNDSMSFFFNDLTIFDVFEDRKNIEIKPLKYDESNSLSNPFVVLKMADNDINATINDFSLLFDVNSYMIPELILSLLKSSTIAKIISPFLEELQNTENEKKGKVEEKESSSTIKLSMPSVDISLIDNDVKLNASFSGIFTISPEINHMFFNNLSLSFSEKEVNFSPIFEKITLDFGIRENTLIFSIDKTNAYVSSSDIIDIQNFVNKIMTLYSNFSHQLDYSKPIEEVEKDDSSSSSSSDASNSIKSLCISNSKIVVEFCEDNRTTQIPFPFLRLSIKPNSNNVSLSKAASFPLIGLQVDIFNKNTQKWDLLVEPLEIFLSFTDTKHFNFKVKDNMNVVLSHAILNQICQYRFERQKIDSKTVLPNFFIENNTHEFCELSFENEDDDSLTIPPQCMSVLRENKPFKFMGMKIDPLNFYSPQFVSNKCSISIFTKGKERHISINSPILFKNRSGINLRYQEKHSGKVTDIFGKSITPLVKLAAEFGIYGKDPQKTPTAINLFRLKEQKRLFIPVQVEDKTYYFFLSIKFSKKRGVVMLTLTPNYRIRNNYKMPIIFTVKDTNQKVTVPGGSIEFLDHDGFESSFNFSIETNGQTSETKLLNLKNKEFTSVGFQENIALSLRFDNDIITIQPPLLVKNLTNLPVYLYDFQNTYIFALKEKNSENFIGTPDFFKEGKIQLAIQVHGYEKSDVFDLTAGRQKIYLKSLEQNGLCVPISLLMTIGATGIFYLKIDHLVYIKNETNETIHFNPFDSESAIKEEKPLDIEPQQTKPLLFGTPELNFKFNVENNKDVIMMNLHNTLENRNKFATLFFNQSTSLKIPTNSLSVDFQTSSTLAGYIIAIKNCVFPQPLVMTNLLGEKDESQKADIIANCGYQTQMSVKPMSTSIISSRDLVGQRLKVSCYNREFEVDLTKFKEPTKETIQFESIQFDIYFKLVCLENGSHLIIVSNEIENKPNKFSLLSTHEISFGLAIPFISLNLIDDQMRELALIGFEKTEIKCEFSKDTVEADLQIGSFQIDDMYPDTIVPVAVFNTSPPFISLKMIKENANMIFDLIELKLNPMTFYIDVNYIAELFNFFTSIDMKRDASIDDDENDVKANTIKSSIPILIKKIFIDKVDINASASSQTGRPTFHPFPYAFLLDYIPSVSNVHLGRKAFTKTDLSSDSKVVNKMLKDYYKPLINEIKGLVAARSIAFVFKSISNAFHKMGDTSKIDVSFNQEKGTVIKRSFQSFGKGLLNGVTGVVMKPIKGAKKDGAKGFFVGLGKGVGGIITDPVAGIIDAGAGIIDEVKNSLSESRDSMRFPRVFNNIQVQEYDRVSAICQLQYQRHRKNYHDNFVYFIDGKEKFVGISESFIAVLQPDEQKKNPSKKYKLTKLRSISDIENVYAFNNYLIINFCDENGFDIECKSNEIAEIATKIIVSRSFYNNYSNNSASMTKMASSDFSTSEELIDEKSIQEQQKQQQEFIIKDGYYSLKNTNGKYVTNDKESKPLIANRGKAKGWEKFKITNNDDGTISFFSCKNKKFVTVGKNSRLCASADKIGRNEKFTVNKCNDKYYNFISMKTGQYVSADRNKLAKVYANRTEAKGWERFELVSRE